MAIRKLPTIILMLTYDTSVSLLHMRSVLKHIQALAAHPTVILIPDIKSTNALFHQLPPLLRFEPRLDAGLQQILMSDLLLSLRAATSTYFTTRYQNLQDDPYILQDI